MKMTAQDYLKSGDLKRNNKDYEGAVKDYDEAIKINPKLMEAYFKRGLAQFELKRYEEALLDYDEVIKFEPKSARTYNNRALTKHELKRYEEALSDFDKVIKLNPKDMYVYFNRGRTKYKLKHYHEAISNYDKVIESDPKDTEAYNNRGNARLALKEYDGAINDYDEALSKDPKNLFASRNRALAIKLREEVNRQELEKKQEEYKEKFEEIKQKYERREKDYQRHRISTEEKIHKSLKIMPYVIGGIIIGTLLFLGFLYPYLVCKFFECDVAYKPFSILLVLPVAVFIISPFIWRILILLRAEKMHHALEEDAFTKRQIIYLISAHPTKDDNKNYQMIRQFIEHHEKRSTADIVMGVQTSSIPQHEIVRAVEKVIKSDKPD